MWGHLLGSWRLGLNWVRMQQSNELKISKISTTKRQKKSRGVSMTQSSWRGLYKMSYGLDSFFIHSFSVFFLITHDMMESVVCFCSLEAIFKTIIEHGKKQVLFIIFWYIQKLKLKQGEHFSHEHFYLFTNQFCCFCQFVRASVCMCLSVIVFAYSSLCQSTPPIKAEMHAVTYYQMSPFLLSRPHSSEAAQIWMCVTVRVWVKETDKLWVPFMWIHLDTKLHQTPLVDFVSCCVSFFLLTSSVTLHHLWAVRTTCSRVVLRKESRGQMEKLRYCGDNNKLVPVVTSMKGPKINQCTSG